jgi:hypothetical protein
MTVLSADPTATGDVISQAIAKAQASGGIQGLASAFSQAIAQGGGGAAQALASGYAEAVGAGNTEATAQAIAAASAEVSHPLNISLRSSHEIAFIVKVPRSPYFLRPIPFPCWRNIAFCSVFEAACPLL